MLHAVYRVGDLDETISYYKKHFGIEADQAGTLSPAADTLSHVCISTLTQPVWSGIGTYLTCAWPAGAAC